MKKYFLFIGILFMLSTGLMLFIVYKDMDHPLSFAFLVGYLIYSLLLTLHLLVLIVINVMKLNRLERKKILLRFSALFIFFSALILTFDYIFRPSELNIYNFGTPLGLASVYLL